MKRTVIASPSMDREFNADLTPIPMQILLTTGDKLNIVVHGGTYGIEDTGDTLIVRPAHVIDNEMSTYHFRKDHIVYIRYYPVSEEDYELKCGAPESAYSYPWKEGVNNK